MVRCAGFEAVGWSGGQAPAVGKSTPLLVACSGGMWGVGGVACNSAVWGPMECVLLTRTVVIISLHDNICVLEKRK